MEPCSVLLVWEEVPERTLMFKLDGLSASDHARVQKAHGTFINSNENDYTNWLQEYLWDSEKSKYRFDPVFDSQAESEPFVVDGTHVVVVAGFVM
jgi:hypothetical protein